MAEFCLRGSNARVQYDFHGLPQIEADESQLRQVFSNLVINARQSMPEGGTISITGCIVPEGRKLHASLDSLPYFQVSIKDTGIGIAPRHLPRIFDPYFTTKSTGSGLGLATCYSIVKKHLGALTVESDLGLGSRFTVLLPCSNSLQSSHPIHPVPTSLPDLKGRLLIVDDHVSVAHSIRRLLEIEGYACDVVHSGTDAVKMYSEHFLTTREYAGIIMDLTIPGSASGSEILASIKNLDPHAKAVVCSGYSSDDVLANFSKYGFVGALVKPFETKDLVAALATF